MESIIEQRKDICICVNSIYFEEQHSVREFVELCQRAGFQVFNHNE